MVCMVRCSCLISHPNIPPVPVVSALVICVVGSDHGSALWFLAEWEMSVWMMRACLS